MKTFNKTLIVPLFITLILTGCMPDSLTKFKKDPPKKPTTSTTVSSGPVLDETGNVIPFDESTYFSFKTPDNDPVLSKVNEPLSTEPLLDGSLGDPVKLEKFFERCDIVTTGVNSQATSLPAGLSFINDGCNVQGTPLSAKSVVTPFCSDGTSFDQVTCESNFPVWNATTGTCSLPDLKYATQTACLAGSNKWYTVGSPIPYKIRLTFHDSAGVQRFYYTTLSLGVYTTLTSLNYTQAEKVLLKMDTAGTSPFGDIIPIITTSLSTGSYNRRSIMINSNGAVTGVARFVDSGANLVGISRLVPIKVNSITGLAVNGFIQSVAGTCTLGAFTTKPTCTFGGGTWTPNKIGKIFKIDSATRTLYVENISLANRYFILNEAICTGTCASSYTINSINDSYLFKADDDVDNDNQYYTPKFTLDYPVNIYEVGTSIQPLYPIISTAISATNGITYSISPALPCEDPTDITKCLYLDANTGTITGTFNNFLNTTEFTLTASNPISSVSTKIKMSAIYGPSDLSLTTKQVITVSSTSNFKEGETLFQPISPPLTEGLNARIIQIINTKQLAIEIFNGAFVPGVSLDNNNSAYQSEKAFIIPYSTCTNTVYTTKASCETGGEVWSPSEPIFFNIILTASTTTGYTAGSDISATAGTGLGAIGKVAHVDATSKKLYIQYLTGAANTTATAKTFYQADTLDSGASVDQVENGSMKVTLASAAGFTKGSDVVTSASAAGYTSVVNGNILTLSELSRASAGTFFKNGQTFYNHETQALSTANSTASAVTFDNYFIFERGKKMYANTIVSNGNGIIYSISPPLPSGLVLNTLTGVIEGAASSTSIKKDYLLTAINFVGSTSFVFSLEVKDFFEVIEKTGASSALLHKVGDYQNNRKCRVDSTDIASMSNGKALDIRCFLDMEEQDIFQTAIKLNFFTGPGICQYIEYAPYYFNSWTPHQSVNVSSRYTNPVIVRTGCTALDSTGPVPTPDLCEGNYSYYDPDFPNCDEGLLRYTSETYTQDDTTGTCTRTSVVSSIVRCGGNKAACLAGPVTDAIDLTNLAEGKRLITIPSSTGLDKTYEHKSPIEFGDSYINVRTANGTTSNQCNSSAANTLTWKNTTSTISTLASPFGFDSNPFYTVTCLDAAYDIKARIRVIVRDWDKAFRIDSDIFNQSFTAPPVNMNNNNPDPIFGKPYNDVDDWDDDFVSYNDPTSDIPVYTPNTCGVQAAGSCSNITGIFRSNAECTAVGGSVVAPGSCSAGGFTNEFDCETSGTCSNGAYLDAGSCAKGTAVWTPRVWTAATCTFANQNQCVHYGGTWTGPEQYKFPELPKI